VAVLFSAAIIQGTGWTPADPLAAVLVSVLIAVSAGRLIRESFHILMEGAPADLDPAEVLAAVARLEGIESVHDFHLWTVSSGWISMSAHLLKRPEADPDAILARARALLKERFGIDHATLQIERSDQSECPTGSCGKA
jgi:cobalt-zinc-cadmium efflux system protein